MQHSSQETWQRWRVIDNTVFYLTYPESNPKPPVPIPMSSTTAPHGGITNFTIYELRSLRSQNQLFALICIASPAFARCLQQLQQFDVFNNSMSSMSSMSVFNNSMSSTTAPHGGITNFTIYELRSLRSQNQLFALICIASPAFARLARCLSIF